MRCSNATSPVDQGAAPEVCGPPTPGVAMAMADVQVPRLGTALPLLSPRAFTVHDTPLLHGVASEAQWMADTAATGRAQVHLWSAPASLVVPRSYERLARWAAACSTSAAAGWPVQVRSSGGGVVPQGPGVLNLSLTWPSTSAIPKDTDAVYQTLCHRLAVAFAQCGVLVVPQGVNGSFCDGRFNLAFEGRKLVGTAQSWRRIGHAPIVLAHAVILVDCDAQELTARANAFEAASGSDRRYRADALTSLAKAWRAAHPGAQVPSDLSSQWVGALAYALTQVI
ncbi:lipoyl protein ligase domain-containing protein [Thiomonas arsenitoxydans]|nr:lipoate--protein ligase [Thiomonas arsenitoxydans]CQR41163.1 putative Lipoate-protein ligase A [Thiomonas arsenitoxydans]